MAVPAVIGDLSIVPASNSPAGSEAVFPNLDDYLRALSAFIAQNYANKAALAGATFTGPVVFNSTISAGVFAATTAVGALSVASSYAQVGRNTYTSVDSSQPANGRISEIVWAAGAMRGRFVNDAYNTSVEWFTVVGNSAGVTSVTFNGTAINLSGNTAPSGNNTFTLGSSGNRWSNTYSVLGNFSGVVTADSVSTTGDNSGRGLSLSRSKSATTSRVSTTTLADDPDLQLALPVGIYAIDCLLPIWGTTSGAGGFKAVPVFTGTASASAMGCLGFGNAAAWANSTVTQAVGGNLFSSNTTTVSTTPTLADWMRITGTIAVTSPGNLKIQWAQVASNANAANVGIGAYLTATRVS